jgi:hypothetical protein
MQGAFLPSLVQIDPVGSEKKLEMGKAYRRRMPSENLITYLEVIALFSIKF